MPLNNYSGMTREYMRKKMVRGWAERTCGKGSAPDAVAPMREWFPDLITRYGIHSIADVGAGENDWFPETDAEYDAYDLVPRAPGVTELDCTSMILPQNYDLVVCRYVLNHISSSLARDALGLLRLRSKYFLMSMFDKQEGYWKEEGLYPLPDAKLLETLPDHDGRKNKRMELYSW